MNRTLLTIAITILLSALPVYSVFLVYQISSKRGGGFTRLFINNPQLPLVSTIDLKSNGYYFAGASLNELYLGNTTRPLHLLRVMDNDKAVITIKPFTADSTRVSKILIEPPYFYLADLTHYTILRGDLHQWQLKKIIHASGFFTEFLPTRNKSLFLRGFDSSKTNLVLTKELRSGNGSFDAPQVLEKQADGIFSTDGVLKYARGPERLIYTYFYRNQFICTDTSLNVLYRANTIDTTSVAVINRQDDYLSSYSTLASPPQLVNRRAYVTDNLLFINSNVKAENETEEVFNTMNVLDIYSLTSGDYLRSVYIPRISKSKLRHFFVIENKIYTIQDRFLMSHEFTYSRDEIR